MVNAHKLNYPRFHLDPTKAGVELSILVLPMWLTPSKGLATLRVTVCNTVQVTKDLGGSITTTRVYPNYYKYFWEKYVKFIVNVPVFALWNTYSHFITTIDHFYNTIC